MKDQKVKNGLVPILTILGIALKLDGILTLSWCWILGPWVVCAFIAWIIDVIVFFIEK